MIQQQLFLGKCGFIQHFTKYTDRYIDNECTEKAMIKNVLIDLDDTILDFKRAEHEALSKSLSEIGIEPAEDMLKRYSEINKWHWRQLEAGILSRNEVLIGRFRQLFEEYSIAARPEEAQEHYEHNLGIGHYFIPGAAKMLEELSAGYRLYLASNGTKDVQLSRIKSADISRYFEDIFISQDIGADKPSAGFFEGVFARVPDMTKPETVIIGDSLTSDIRGGQNFGLTTIWYNPRGEKNDTISTENPVRPDFEIDALTKAGQVLSTIQ